MSVLGVIPARWASTRFPGKILAPLAGKPMIRHVWERASRAQAVDRLVVATDHREVAEAVEAFGAEAVMTPEDCASGTDRIAVVAEAIADAALVVNIQGDEPLLEPTVIDQTVEALRAAPWASVGTAMTPIRDREAFESPHNCKVVTAEDGRALYFSRSPLPSRARVEPRAGEPWGMKHLGLYAYRREALLAFASRPPSLLEGIEKLEQLRFLAAGQAIVVVETPHDCVGVDTPEELAEAERLLLAEAPRR
jgi:3-deoxy-manno-octulosonate cytidylyltransferase (CMP-KDO synthetase)